MKYAGGQASPLQISLITHSLPQQMGVKHGLQWPYLTLILITSQNGFIRVMMGQLTHATIKALQQIQMFKNAESALQS